MSPDSISYRRLPGMGSSLSFYIRLYQGPDHLLQVMGTGFSETYKRFYFQDIQAITVRRTVTGLAVNLITGAFTAFCGWAFLFSTGAEAGAFGVLGALGLIVLLVNLLLGPTVSTQIQTAVQTEKLASLVRLRNVRRTLLRVLPLIESAQGALTPAQPQPVPSSLGQAPADAVPPVVEAGEAAEPNRMTGPPDPNEAG
jgi:hypothetical protein